MLQERTEAARRPAGSPPAVGEAAPLTTETPALTGLTEPARQLALERFGLLRPCLEEGVPLAHVARERGLQLRTLQRWLRAYRQHGLAGLVGKPYRNRGRRRLPTELEQLIEGLALRRPRLICAAVHRKVLAIAHARGWAAPSYATVYSVMRGLAPDLMTLAQQGRRSTPTASICCIAGRPVGPTRCGKPTARPWTCGCSTNAGGQRARG